jgi:1-acyl-sn-glycerol-3-phosphate acyltransferase
MAAESDFTIDVTLDPKDLEELFEPFDPWRHEAQMPSGPAPNLKRTRTRHDPIDWDYLYSLIDGFMGDVMDRYFRAELIGHEKLPDDGPLILAPNHSGNAFPHDAIVLDAALWRASGYTRAGKFRSVYTPQLAATWWMRPFDLDNWWRRGGGVDMTFTNYDKLLERGDRVIYYPEGVPGIGKGFTRRYQLQHFHSSFVVLAAKHDAPVYPVSVVNAEWVNPTSVTFESMDKLFRKVLGIPFLPLPIAPLALLFPFIFYLAFPCQMTFVVQRPVNVRQMLREEGCTDVSAPSRDMVLRVAERIQERAQHDLNAAVEEYGEKPYDWESLKREMNAIKGKRLRTTPLGWPLSFVTHDRDRKRPPAKNWLHKIVRDLDIAAWYMPFGWFLIALIRKLRKPPYGYRGLSEDEKRRTQGSYRWSLDDQPLPPRPTGDSTPSEAP